TESCGFVLVRRIGILGACCYRGRFCFERRREKPGLGCNRLKQRTQICPWLFRKRASSAREQLAVAFHNTTLRLDVYGDPGGFEGLDGTGPRSAVSGGAAHH